MNPTELARLSVDVAVLADALADEALATAKEQHDFAPLGGGDGWAALTERLGSLADPLTTSHEQMSAVADILATSSELAQLLDDAVARVKPFLPALPAAQATYGALQALGLALDVACAAQIRAVCTPHSELPNPVMADFPERSPAEIHEFHLPFAPDHIQELAAANPDMVILELPDGGLVAAVGADPAAGPVDLSGVDTVTTYVPGVGSADPASWQDQLNRTRDLARAAGGSNSAGVFWLGYPAPHDLGQALRPGPARRAGDDLARFQAELHRRNPDQRRVVLGYSYGSVVASEAARTGMHADDMVLLASPGATVAHVDDYRLYGDNPSVHAMTSPNDPIGLTTGPLFGVHGVDPTSPRFGAEVHDPGVNDGHSGYFQGDGIYPALEKALR